MHYKSHDYKQIAVRHYIEQSHNMEETCRIFDCKIKTLGRWIQRYREDGNIERHNRIPRAYKMKQSHVDEAVNYLQKRKHEIIDGKSIIERETELSIYNKKTMDFERFKEYIVKKNEINRRLASFYNEYIFRKLKLGGYIRRQITEARLIKRFKKLFGSPKETVITIGDFE
jgi:transposase-like protein